MSTTPYVRILTGIVFLATAMMAGNTRVQAQTCVCPASQQQTKQITICFNGANQQVDVTFCSQTYCPPVPPATPDPCDPPNDPIDATMVIYQICPVGFVTTDAQGLMNATIAAMGLCCGNQLGLFNCTSSTTQYQWIVRWPKCVIFDANTNCLVACQGSPCCGFRVLFQTTAAGFCETIPLDNCSDPTTCTAGSGCIELQCTYPTQCCW